MTKTNGKPDWKDAPEGYNYLAQDRNGSWYWYKEKPEPRSHGWWSEDGTGKMASENPKWRDTLEERSIIFSDLKEGDWVKVTDEGKEIHAIVTKITADSVNTEISLPAIDHQGKLCYYGTHYLGTGNQVGNPHVQIVGKLNPKDIVLEIGLGGIKGIIENNNNDSFFVIEPNSNPQKYSMINKSMLSETMRELVDGILKKQEQNG